MITLEQQVVSLDLAKEMKSLGFKQQSLFWWRFYRQSGSSSFDFPEKGWKIEIDNRLSLDGSIAAYTVSELWKFLPNEYYTFYAQGLRYVCSDRRAYNSHFEEQTEANARAKMCIHLAKTGVIKTGGG